MSTDGRSTAARTEPRWPPALAVLVLIALPFLLPEHLTVGPSWLLPTIGFLFFVAIAVADPTRMARRVRIVRLLAIGLTAVFIAGGAVMTFELGDDLIHTRLTRANVVARAEKAREWQRLDSVPS